MPKNNINGPEARYFAFLEEGRLLIQQCDHCLHYIFYPRVFCTFCEHDQLTWSEISTQGTVYSTTTVRLDPLKPHNVALIDLDVGIRMMSRVVGIGSDQVSIGMRVLGSIVRENDRPLVVFSPAEVAQ